MEKHGQGVKRLNETVRKVVACTLIVLGALSLVFLFFSPHATEEIYGLATGGTLGIFAFLDLKNALVRSSVMKPQKAKAYAAFRYFIRFAVIGVVFALIFKSPHTGVLGGVIGFSTVKVVVYATHLFDDKAYFSKLFRREK
ncbi:MAG: ATP synthase subunit I [Bacillota bacterium]|nr:ATP synthase subunit I [Bacillota bacterium]